MIIVAARDSKNRYVAPRRSSSYSAVVLDTIFPEAAGGELFLDDDGESVDQTLTDSHDVTWSERAAHISQTEAVVSKM